MSALWQEARNPEGRVYYYNVQTKATQWTKPVELMTPAERILHELPWKQHQTDDGRPYWYHAETRQTTWEMPEAYRQALDRSQGSHSLPGHPQQQFVAGGTQQFGRQYDNQDRQLAIMGQSQDSPNNNESNGRNVSLPHSLANDRDDPQYSNQDEAEAAFMKLLRRSGVSADWTWEQTMRTIIKESHYRALKDPKDRKAAFEKFIVELKQQELEKAKDRMTKLRQDFAVMLKSHPEIKFYTRWKTARPMIEGETIFRSTSDENERRQLFDEYILELRKAEQEREKAVRKEATDELFSLLKSLDLEPYTRWSEAQNIIKENDRFQAEENFQALSKLDILNAFENHIKVLERQFNDKRQKTKNMKMRKERKNREAFVALLSELREKGDIRSGTKWKYIHPLIQDDERYLNMLGQPGSTPLDLFWDTMEEVERDIRIKKNIALDVLDDKHFEIREQTTFEEFASILRADSRTAQFDRETVTVLFEKLREKVVKRLEDDRHHQERHQRRRIDALRSAIKHLEPPVELTDTWEQVRLRIQNLEEYKALETEELRRTAFDKFIRRLKEKQEDREFRDRDRKDRERGERDRDREKDREGKSRAADSRNGHHSSSYHKPSSSRHHRDGPHLSRSPEPDAYEAERRRAAGERERQYQHRGARSSSHHPSERGSRAESRHRHERQESIYDRERREREEERERQYRSRGDDEYRSRRRPRGLSPDESEDGRRDSKRSRRDRSPRDRTPRPRTPRTPVLDYSRDLRSSPSRPAPAPIPVNPVKAEKMNVDHQQQQRAEESEEGEIAE
ncbi:U1 snRNP protein [Rhizina undulata]